MSSPDGRACRRPGVRCRLLALAVLLVLTGCSGSNGSDEPASGRGPSVASPDDSGASSPDTTARASSTPTASVPPSEPTASTPISADDLTAAEREVVARYVGYWDVRFAANAGTPNPDDPRLAEYATGEELAKVVSETRANRDEGRAFRPAERPANTRRVNVVSIADDRATVQDCWVDDGVVVDRATGRVLNDQVTTYNGRADLLRVEGRWRVAATRLLQRWEGVAGCALVP